MTPLWTSSHWIWGTTIAFFFLRWVLSQYFWKWSTNLHLCSSFIGRIHAQSPDRKSGFSHPNKWLWECQPVGVKPKDSWLSKYILEGGAECTCVAEKAGIFEAQQTWMQIPALPVTSCMILDMILISQCTCMSNGVNNNCFLLLRLWILNAAVKPFVKYLEYCEKSSFPACVVCIG